MLLGEGEYSVNVIMAVSNCGMCEWMLSFVCGLQNGRKYGGFECGVACSILWFISSSVRIELEVTCSAVLASRKTQRHH
jgi:hypothetical protein